MIDFSDFYQAIAKTNLSHWLESIPAQLAQWQQQQDGRLKSWLKQVENLPLLTPTSRELLHSVTVKSAAPLSAGQQKQLTHLLMQLGPWRKGPFSLYGVEIDTEWRSDWKWQRVLPHLAPLAGRKVLDIGCNSGYHLWRMLGQDAKLVVGIDPMALYLCQFLAVQKLLGGDLAAYFLPLGIEALPASAAFDTVFSMGVLYHRRSPLDHLYQLKDQLTAGGQLVLETLVVDGDAEHVLVPGERYAQMRNVYFIPSIEAMQRWLLKCGFVEVQVVDVSITTTDEQRRTDWMTSESLADFLDTNDKTKTVEGYPAPKRAVFIAKRP